MSVVGQFLLNNLLPALLAGSMAWALVHLAVNALAIRHGKLRLCLYMAPLLKSTLVLLGLATVLAWPRDVFGPWAARAVEPEIVLPWFVLLTGAGLLARRSLALRSQRDLVASAYAAEPGGRLSAALDAALDAYQTGAPRIQAYCSLDRLPHRPRLLIRDRGLRSPAVITAGDPTIVFPRRLVDRLDDAGLRAAIAHELAHVYLQQPGSCFSAETVRVFTALNPFAGLIAAQLHREEEKACDDVAVDVVGDPDGYAAMLLESYRFAAGTAGGLLARVQFVPQLLGVRPMLSERVEHLMARSADPGTGRQRLAFAFTWVLLIGLFFTS